MCAQAFTTKPKQKLRAKNDTGKVEELGRNLEEKVKQLDELKEECKRLMADEETKKNADASAAKDEA